MATLRPIPYSTEMNGLWYEGCTVATAEGKLFASADGETAETIRGPDAPYLYLRFEDLDAGDNCVQGGGPDYAAGRPVPAGCRRIYQGLVGRGISAAAASLGRLGGRSKSEAKAAAGRVNGGKGGRPASKAPTRADLRDYQRTGDVHGNAPRFCPSHQYHSPAHASIYAEFSAAQVRRAYIAAGLSYCRTCQGWH